MLFKLALRNITAKPVRAIATVIAIAAAIAMSFAMLSFKPAVYEFMYATQTAVSGGYDIRISTSSSSSRLTATSSLLDEAGKPNVEGVQSVVPSFKLFATVDDEYVQARGFAYGNENTAAEDMQILQRIQVAEGSLDDIKLPDDIVISRAAAKHFGVGVGDCLRLTLGGRSKDLYVKVIARDSGYFLADSPYLVLGFSKTLSELMGMSVELCNEIYVKTAPDVDVDAMTERIKAIPQYSDLLVGRAVDAGKVEEQSTSLTAPIVLAGAAVMLLSVCVVALLFLMGEKEKLSLLSSLRVIGATKGQILAVFATEGLLLAAVGALVGAGLAVGVYVGILRLTLSASAAFTISAWRLLAAAGIGFCVAVASSFLPAAVAFRRTVRANMLALDKKTPVGAILSAIFFVAFVALLATLLAADGLSAAAEAAIGIALLAVSLAVLAFGLPVVIRLLGRAGEKSSVPVVKTASYRLAREKRPSRSAAVLGVGMAISMLLFMAWSLTTNIFSAYLKDFENMVIVSNVRADADLEQFQEVDGVGSAVKLVWKQGKLSSPALDRSVQIIGSADALKLANFRYVTDENIVRARLAGEGDYAFVDEAFCKLYEIGEGDALNLTVDGETRPVTVGGVLSHRLFNGAYVIVGEGLLDRLFGLKPDTVIVTTDSDVQQTAYALSEKFSSKNFYVVEALEAFRWDMQTVESVFDLIGTLAFTVAAFILAATVANTLVGRAGEHTVRRSLLSAGMSKDMLLSGEIAEHGAIALVSYAAAFVFSLPMTAGLISALKLFGLSFEFMFEAWVIATVGAVMGAFYALVPLILNFKRSYSLKK